MTEKILTVEDLVEIEALSAKVPDGPWFTAPDHADDVPDHRRSGLALVETGRSADWWIARLCEWHTASFIAESKTNVDVLCATVRHLMEENQRLKVSHTAEQKDHQLTIDTFRQQEKIWQQKHDEFISDAAQLCRDKAAGWRGSWKEDAANEIAGELEQLK